MSSTYEYICRIVEFCLIHYEERSETKTMTKNRKKINEAQIKFTNCIMPTAV